MTDYFQSVVIAELNKLVGICPVELAFFRLYVLRFHAVLGNDGVEILLHDVNCFRLLAVNLVDVHGTAN